MNGDVVIGSMVLRNDKWIYPCAVIECDEEATNDVRVTLGHGTLETPLGQLEVVHTSAAHVCQTHYGDPLLNFLCDVFGEATGHKVGELL